MPRANVKPPFLRTPYNYDTNEASDESGLLCKDPSLTQQQFADESDINFIADRYGLGQLDPSVWQQAIPAVLQPPSYGDFTGIFNFQAVQNAAIEAKNAFMTLPAKLRTRFNNDPQQLIQFLDNPENAEEARFLGLLKEKTDETGTGSTAPEATQTRPGPAGTQKNQATPAGTQSPGPEGA